jgi:hypothetical protein
MRILIKEVGMRKAIAFLFVLALVLPFLLSSNLQAQGRQRFGLSLGGGVGFITSDYVAEMLSRYEEDGYIQSASDSSPSKVYLFKEFQVVADIAFFRLSAAIGFSNYSYIAHLLWNSLSEDHDFGLSLMPISISLSVYPLRFKNPNTPVQLFLGAVYQSLNMDGPIISASGNLAKNSIGPLVGIDAFIGEILTLGLEARYLFALETGLGGGNFSSVLYLRFRVPFSRRQF